MSARASQRSMARLFVRLTLPLIAFLALGAASIDFPIQIREGRITVRAQKGMESAARKVANAAPGFLDEIAADLPDLPVPRDIEIRLVRRSSSLPAAAPAGRGAPSWAAGVAYPDLGIVTVAQAGENELNDILSVTAHELAHLAIEAALKGNVPRWLNEGFAYLHSSDWSVARTQVLAGMAWSGNTIPLYELDERFPSRESAVHKAYAQSYDFVAFLAKRGRYADKRDDGDRWPFRTFLASLANGNSVQDAATFAYGSSIVDLYDEWGQDLRDRYMFVPISLFSLALWAFAALLLVLGYLRKTRQAKRVLARWEEEERARERARQDLETLRQIAMGSTPRQGLPPLD